MHVEWFNVEGVTFDAACFAGFALIKQTSEKPITTIKNAFFIPLLIDSEQTTTNYFLYFNESGRNRDTHWSITYWINTFIWNICNRTLRYLLYIDLVIDLLIRYTRVFANPKLNSELQKTQKQYKINVRHQILKC